MKRVHSGGSDRSNKKPRRDTEIVSSVIEKKLGYQDFFRYENKNRDHFATCLLCEQKKISRTIKRTGGNTKGLSSHLEREHVREYQKLFPSAEKKDRNQTLLNFTVSTIYFTTNL